MTFSCLERATESWLIICNLLGWGGVLAASATSCVWGEWSEEAWALVFVLRQGLLFCTAQANLAGPSFWGFLYSSPVGGLRSQVCVLAPTLSSGTPNPGPHICPAKNLATEPSFQPSTLFLRCLTLCNHCIVFG